MLGEYWEAGEQCLWKKKPVYSLPVFLTFLPKKTLVIYSTVDLVVVAVVALVFI